MKSKEFEELLGKLHEETAKALLEALESRELSSGVLNAAINLLKHNNIQAHVEPGDPMDKIDKRIHQELEEEEFENGHLRSKERF